MPRQSMMIYYFLGQLLLKSTKSFSPNVPPNLPLSLAQKASELQEPGLGTVMVQNAVT
jgi:hypothetical protein